jgi:tungstate transport system substrate-binding protein
MRGLVWLAVVALAACGRAEPPIVLATTTSVGNSGLLDRLLPEYDEVVRPVLVGSGRAIEMLASGTADVVISHAPEREAAALGEHPVWWYRKILFNDFLIVGPPHDPARVRNAQDAVDAMRRIAAGHTTFLSRGDESGTHERERGLWREAGVQPDGERLVVAGAGMGQTLRIASGTGAYTLTDRGTFAALRQSVDLEILHEGDERLLNTYAVLADPRRTRGELFARWLAEGDGQRVLRELLSGGEVRGFSVWPNGAGRDRPDAPPRPR